MVREAGAAGWRGTTTPTRTAPAPGRPSSRGWRRISGPTSKKYNKMVSVSDIISHGLTRVRIGKLLRTLCFSKFNAEDDYTNWNTSGQ